LCIIIFNQFLFWEQTYSEQKRLFSEYPAVMDWAGKRLDPGEKIVTVSPWYLGARYPLSEIDRLFLDTESFTSDDPSLFIQECLARQGTHLAWVSSISGWGRVHYYHLQSRGYLLNELDLGSLQSRHTFQWITELTAEPGHTAHIYRIHPVIVERMAAMRFDFHRPADLTDRLGSGWSQLTYEEEGNYIWAMGPRSDFSLVLPRGDLPGLLHFRAQPFAVPAAGPQLVALSVNGQTAGTITLGPELRLYRCSLSPSLLRAGENRFSFTYSNYARPADLGLSSDERLLAVQFHQLYLYLDGLFDYYE
jgi:hypothetical protein